MIIDLARLLIQRFSSTAVCVIIVSLPISADAGNIGYVDASGDGYFTIRNGALYTQVLGEKTYVRIGVPVRISDNILRVGSTYYCRWEGYAEHQVKKFNNVGAVWECTSNGIQPKTRKHTESQENARSNKAARSSVAPSFPGSGERKPGVLVKKVYQPVLGTMRAGKNYFGQGIVELQIASRDLGNNQEIVRSFNINCSTRDWRFLDPDAAWFGGIQEMFGKFSHNAVGTWACNRYGFKY